MYHMYHTLWYKIDFHLQLKSISVNEVLIPMLPWQQYHNMYHICTTLWKICTTCTTLCGTTLIFIPTWKLHILIEIMLIVSKFETISPFLWPHADFVAQDSLWANQIVEPLCLTLCLTLCLNLKVCASSASFWVTTLIFIPHWNLHILIEKYVNF